MNDRCRDCRSQLKDGEGWVCVECKKERARKNHKVLWWGYLHQTGTIHTKRFFSQEDIDEAKESPFVNQVFGPWEVENKAEAEKKIREEADKRISFIHSKCHNAHWELSINSKGIYNLTCEKCGLPIGPSIVVMGNTDVKAGDCDICKTMRKP